MYFSLFFFFFFRATNNSGWKTRKKHHRHHHHQKKVYGPNNTHLISRTTARSCLLLHMRQTRSKKQLAFSCVQHESVYCAKLLTVWATVATSRCRVESIDRAPDMHHSIPRTSPPLHQNEPTLRDPINNTDQKIEQRSTAKSTVWDGCNTTITTTTTELQAITKRKETTSTCSLFTTLRSTKYATIAAEKKRKKKKKRASDKTKDKCACMDHDTTSGATLFRAVIRPT